MYEEKEKCILASPLFGNGVKKGKEKKVSAGQPAVRLLVSQCGYTLKIQQIEV